LTPPRGRLIGVKLG